MSCWNSPNNAVKTQHSFLSFVHIIPVILYYCHNFPPYNEAYFWFPSFNWIWEEKYKTVSLPTGEERKRRKQTPSIYTEPVYHEQEYIRMREKRENLQSETFKLFIYIQRICGWLQTKRISPGMVRVRSSSRLTLDWPALPHSSCVCQTCSSPSLQSPLNVP